MSSRVGSPGKPAVAGGSGLVGSIQKDFNTMTWVLIPVAIAINIAIGQIVLALKLPVFLDSIGTVLVGVLCGPWAGALTGLLSNLLWGVALDPNLLPWFPIAAVIGAVAGILAKFGLFKNWWKTVISGFIIALSAAITGAPIAVLLFGGITSSGSSVITAFLLQTGQGLITSVFSTNFLVEPVDKISTALLAFSIIEGLSARYLARFPRPENVALEQQGDRRTQILIAVGVVVALILIGIFVISRLVSQ